MPAIHRTDSGEQLLVKVQVKDTGYTSGVLQPLFHQLVELFLGDRLLVFEAARKRIRMRICLFREIGAQAQTGMEQLICCGCFEILLRAMTSDMVCGPSGVGHLPSELFRTLCFEAFLYCLPFLQRDALSVQIGQRLLHQLFNVCPVLGELAV